MTSETPAPNWGAPGKNGMIAGRDALGLLDNLATGILVFDSKLRLQVINSAAEALLSISARRMLGRRLEHVVPDVPLLRTAVERSLLAAEALTERDIALHAAGGELVTVDCMITPLLDDAQTREIVVELINVDRLRRIVHEENMVAQQNVATAFIHGMAHEVKNPLGGIRGAAQLLERELSSESQREYTRIIIGEVDRLRNLVDRLLLPDAAVHKVPVNIHEIFEHIRNLVMVESTGIPIHRDYDPSLPELLADRDHLVQALLNIVRNAMQAIGESGGEITLRTRAARQITMGGKRHRVVVRIDIVDSGPGVPPQIAHQIFYPMITGRPEGTGLGLAIARSLIHKQGGSIEFESRPGHTAFSILLPAGGCQ